MSTSQMKTGEQNSGRALGAEKREKDVIYFCTIGNSELRDICLHFSIPARLEEFAVKNSFLFNSHSLIRLGDS